MKKNYYIILLLALTVIISVYFAPFLLHLKDIEYRMYLSEKLNSLGLKGIIALISFFALQLAIPFLPGEPLEIISGAIWTYFRSFICPNWYFYWFLYCN